MSIAVAQVVLSKTAFSYDKLYSYSVPSELLDKCSAGCRVVVPFGKGNTRRQGLIISLTHSNDSENLKSIISVVDKEPIISDEMLKLCLWFHDRLFCTYYDAVNAVLPTGVSLKMVDFYTALPFETSALAENETAIYNFILNNGDTVPAEKISKKFGLEADLILHSLLSKNAIAKTTDAVQKMTDATEKSVRISGQFDESANIKLTERQSEILEVIESIGAVSVKELQYFTGVSLSVIDALVKKGVLEYYKKPIYRKPVYEAGKDDGEIILTDEQQKAFDTLAEKLNVYNNALLYGVTGSGKTKVFLKLVDKVVAENRGVIIMVPEISLTPQTISAFNNRYNGKIAVFHSAMSLGQRMDEWKRIRDGKAQIAIGTRSAVFAPFSDLGLIIMDEEHEHTYKSEQSPRFHARDVASFRAAYHKCLFLMASATPSIRTYSNALAGKYTLCKLTQRYGNAVLPEVLTVDMRNEIRSGNTGVLSQELYDEITNALNNDNQAIVLLNRRGHNTYVSCPSCNHVVTCPNCSISLTYHSANCRLMCHYCGYSVPYFNQCPECNEGTMRFSGAGTQRAEDELKMLFPNAQILRMDADSTLARGAFSENLKDFADKKYDIMLGTQMVAKGLDFPSVTVVGVIGADRSAYSSDYRSMERTFSLLTQVIGRAGRGDKSGVAVVQTNDPDESIIELATMQDYEAFYNEEIQLRKLRIYPPYCDIISIMTQSISQVDALDTANNILSNLRTLVSDEFSDVKIIALGPAPANIPRVNNKYRFTLTLKCKNNARTRELVRFAISKNICKDTSVTVDVNPETFF